MRRNIRYSLLKWKASKFRKPLIIFGARQIGKTYSILDFGKTAYKNCVYCNFEDTPSLADIFLKDLHPRRIVSELASALNTEIAPEETLIFFDEIQSCERALTALKYFNEEANEYHIIAAGSLLGLALNRGQFSFPVGKVDMLNMYPLSFEEFLLATDNANLIEQILASYKTFSPLSAPLHLKAVDLYRTYLAVGGYPEVVKKYVETKDFNIVRDAQSSIANAYIADMSKYATPADTVKSMEIYNTIYNQFAKETVKFQYSAVNKKARSSTYETALTWLKAASVVIPSVKITEGKMPINLYEEKDTFKIYYCDVGLMSIKMGAPAKQVIQNIGLSDKARGILAENFVAEELTNKGFELHYWESSNTAELDFVIQINGDAIPVEVKSAENVRAKSLSTYIGRYDPPYALRISTKNFGYENGIKSIPMYAIFCL